MGPGSALVLRSPAGRSHLFCGFGRLDKSLPFRTERLAQLALGPTARRRSCNRQRYPGRSSGLMSPLDDPREGSRRAAL